ARATRGNRGLRQSLGFAGDRHATHPVRRTRPAAGRAHAARTAEPAAARNTGAPAGYRRSDSDFTGKHPFPRTDFASWLAVEPSRSDNRLEVGQERAVIMRARGIEHDQIELAVDHGSDHSALAP